MGSRERDFSADQTSATDEELVAASNRGEEWGFEGLYHRYRDWVVSLALRLTGQESLALDVMQETFIYLLGKFPGFKLTARMKTFLYPAVKNLSIGARRKARRMSGAADDVMESAEARPEGGAALAYQDLISVVGGLPETHRDVVLMRFVDGLSLEEIAEVLGIPTGTVKSRLHNAIGMLREDERVRKYFGRREDGG